MKTKVPHLPRMPIIGNLHQIAGKDILGRFIEACQGFYPVTELDVLGRKLLMITSVDLAKEVFDETHYDKFIDQPLFYIRKMAGDGLFTAWTDEPNWGKAHNILLPGFANKAIAGYIPLMQKTIDELIDKWKKQPNNIDVGEDMTRLTFETIGLCGFDFSFESFKSETRHPFVEAMLFTFTEAIQLSRTLPFMKPFRFKRNKQFKDYIEYMNNVLDDIIRKRRAEPEKYTDKIDFLQLMLHATDKETGEGLSDENIRYQIVTFLIAGHETTGGLLSFAIYNLLNHPEALKLAYQEVDEVLGTDKTKEISQADFKNLKYLRQVLMESLRLFPPVLAFTRYSKEDRMIGEEGYPVKANQCIFIFSYYLHRDKKHWGENPEAFDPGHFTAEAIANRDRDAFKAFGHGQRVCMGQHFAMLEATLALAKILQNFEMTLNAGYKMELVESLTMKPKGMKISVLER